MHMFGNQMLMSVQCVAPRRGASCGVCGSSVLVQHRVPSTGSPATSQQRRITCLNKSPLQTRAAKTSGPKATERLPQPLASQQTLRRSFAVGGIGLHTGAYALVRVLPAFAGEGRYFVRVQDGTNTRHWRLEQPEELDLEEEAVVGQFVGGNDDTLNAKLLFEYIEAQQASGSFSGTFADFLQQRASLPPDSLFMHGEAELMHEEQPSPGRPGELRLQAHVSNMQRGHQCCTVLAKDDMVIWGVEHLLAALESCGVDNARIEIEGGTELPIIDGSALGWATEIERIGTCSAPTGQSPDPVPQKHLHSLEQEITVREGEAFITFYPGPSVRVSAGVDCSAVAPVIGRQWFTWSPEGGIQNVHDCFLQALAPARMCFPSIEAVQALVHQGLLQGGTDYVSLVADSNEWLDASMVRFPSDEAARHAIVDLLGDLSLLARPGGRGLPAGHVVAYQPTHELQAKFVARLDLELSISMQ